MSTQLPSTLTFRGRLFYICNGEPAALGATGQVTVSIYGDGGQKAKVVVFLNGLSWHQAGFTSCLLLVKSVMKYCYQGSGSLLLTVHAHTDSQRVQQVADIRFL